MVRDDPGPAPPEQRPVTREGLAENNRKQAAYAARPRAWTERQVLRQPGPEPEPTPEPIPRAGRPATATRPHRGRSAMVHDKRQGRLDL